MTKGDSPRRRSLRLRGYDYSWAGAYFVTVCTYNRASLFGEIVNGEMQLNDVGQVARRVWDGLPRDYQHVELDAVVMPNHVHGILTLAGAGFKPAPARTH